MTGLDVRLKRRAGAFALDLAFKAGNGVTGIIGPSGAGKSMVLQMIAGLDRPDEGHIRFEGNEFTDTSRGIHLSPERRRIGYVFQDPCLFPHMSVAQNLDYGARRRDAARSVSRTDIVELLGLGSLLTRRPHHLSGGEAQRVAIGRALLSAPRLILMDEPLSSLDIRRRREIMPFIEALHRRLELPILYVSHNVDEIVELADRVLVLHDGRIAAEGEVADVLNRTDVQALILGDGHDDDPATIVEAKIARRDEAHYLTGLAFGRSELTIGWIEQPLSTSVRLRIHARDVALATEKPVGVSIQNIIEARIVALDPAGAGQMDVWLAVEGARVKLRSRVTMRSAARLRLAPGLQVWALIKTVALASSAQSSAA